MVGTEEQAIVSLYTKLLAAWNAQDATGMAALFADDGAQVGFDGSLEAVTAMSNELRAAAEQQLGGT